MKRKRVRPNILLLPDSYVYGLSPRERARHNREMVARKENIEFYLRVENCVGHLPWNIPLPKWVPVGEGT